MPLKALDDELNDVCQRSQKLEDDLFYACNELEKANNHINRLERFLRENNVRLLIMKKPKMKMFSTLSMVFCQKLACRMWRL